MRFQFSLVVLVYVVFCSAEAFALQIFVNPGAGGAFLAVDDKPAEEAARAFLGPDVEWQRLSGRLEGQLASYQHWLKTLCQLTEEQARQVSVACGASFERAKGRHEANRKPHREFDFNEYLSTPIIFTGYDEAAPSLFDRELKDAVKSILTTEQMAVLDREMAARKARVHQVCVDRVTEIIHEMMVLSPKQREAVHRELLLREPQFRNALYCFSSSWKEMKSQLLDEQAWFPVSLVTEAQLARPGIIRKGFDWPNEKISLEGCTQEELLQKIEGRSEESRATLVKYLSVFIDGYRDQLDEQAYAQLQLASQGAVERFLVEYNRGQISFLFSEEYSNHDHFYLQSPCPFLLDYDTFWQTVLKTGKLNEVVHAHSPERVAQYNGYIQMLFDQELWLVGEQVDPFRTRIAEELNRISMGAREHTSFKEFRADLWVMGRLMHSIPEEEVEMLLSREQFLAWLQLKKEFTLELNELHYQMRFGAYPLGQFRLIPAPDNN